MNPRKTGEGDQGGGKPGDQETGKPDSQGAVRPEKLLSLKIEEAIGEGIRKKEYLPGRKLPTEEVFCAMYSVSRTVVREALRRLSARGLVRIRQGSGAYVEDISSEPVIDSINLYLEMSDQGNMIFDVIRARQLFEPGIAGMAALLRTDEQVEALAENMRALRDCALEDIGQETEIDNRFHLLVSMATQNPVVSLLMRPIFDSMPRVKQSIFAKSRITDPPGEKAMLVQFHEDIFQAILRKDQGEAAYAMRAHIKRTERNFLDSQPAKDLLTGIDG